ncbi:hypothetical protein [Edaphobacter aggregans]|uniref:hypothetical protein n=1 Tax=Edaphobacter aggregans TaxID=570835 RepID=UPI000552784A|nr:hypothetical protein [Edaphobacter aggregans]
MAITKLQVTLGAGATRFSSTPLRAKWATIQNNAAAVMRIGDSAVSAARGYSLATGSALQVPGTVPDSGSINLADWFAFGTAAQVIDVVYDSVNF